MRPVAEFYFDKVLDGQQTYSALAGAIWQVNDKLSFDVGARYALVDGRPVAEFRAGLTFGFSLGKQQSAQMPTPNLLGRR